MNAMLIALALSASPGEPTLDALKFSDDASRARHLALRSWMEAHSKGFRHVPLRAGGNFLSERWCASKVAASACEGAAVANDTSRGTVFRSLETLHYELPAAFGLVLSVGDIPEKGDLGVRIWLSEGGRSVVGDGFSVTWLRLDGAKVVEELALGSQAALSVMGKEISTPAVPWRDALGRMRETPESLLAFARSQLDALEARVAQAFAGGEIQGFDEGKYEGRGIPPRRTPRPLTAEEEKRERATAKAELERRNAFVGKHAKAMHARLADLPVEVLLAPEGKGR